MINWETKDLDLENIDKTDETLMDLFIMNLIIGLGTFQKFPELGCSLRSALKVLTTNVAEIKHHVISALSEIGVTAPEESIEVTKEGINITFPASALSLTLSTMEAGQIFISGDLIQRDTPIVPPQTTANRGQL